MGPPGLVNAVFWGKPKLPAILRCMAGARSPCPLLRDRLGLPGRKAPLVANIILSVAGAVVPSAPWGEA